MDRCVLLTSTPKCVVSPRRAITRVREFTGHRWIPLDKASDAELWCFIDLRLNKRLSKSEYVLLLLSASYSLLLHVDFQEADGGIFAEVWSRMSRDPEKYLIDDMVAALVNMFETGVPAVLFDDHTGLHIEVNS